MFDTKLSPCPFCGDVAEWEYTEYDLETETGDDGTGHIECKGCHVKMVGYDREDTEQRWNTRHNTESHKAG